MEQQITSKEWFAQLHHQINRRVSFNTFIQQLRKVIAKRYSYIMNNVSYDEMLLDLIKLGEVDYSVLSKVKLEKVDE